MGKSPVAVVSCETAVSLHFVIAIETVAHIFVLMHGLGLGH